MKDTTEAKKNNEELFRLLIEGATQYAIIMLDPAGNVCSWNTGAERLLGYSEAEIIGESGIVFFTPEDRATGQFEIELSTAAREGRAEDNRWHVKKDNSRFFATGIVSPLITEEGHLRGYVKIMRDNTAQRLAEEALKKSNEELERRLAAEMELKQTEAALKQTQVDFQLVVNSISEYAIILLDKDGRITHWNQGAVNILGYTAEEAQGQSIALFLTHEDAVQGLALHCLQYALVKGQFADDKWYMRKGGERFFGTGMIQRMADEAGNLRGFALILRDITARKLVEEQTIYLANHDTLTGLTNRTSFSNRLHEELADAQRRQTMIAVLLLDLDRFKYINDTLGHHAGDMLLKEVAKRLMSCIRETDTVSRLGGDEFIVIQTGIQRIEDVNICAQKIVHELARPYTLDGLEVHSCTSIGVTIYPKDAQDAVQLLKNADIAMYKAKSFGGSNYQFYTDQLNSAVRERNSLEALMRHAIKNGEMELHYQPQINLGDWKISGVEALLRWKNPVLQTISIAKLVELAEETGLINQIGKWVLQSACQQIKIWRDMQLPSFRMAVNLSVCQFREQSFLGETLKILKDHHIPPQWLELEISEKLFIANNPFSNTLHEFKELGMQITVDDFGTGYSALNHLRQFPVDVIKIDQSLIQHLPHRRQDAAITSSIIGLARNLDICVVAEGVESTEQLAFLKTEQCTTAQGFLFSHPLLPNELELLLRQGNWSHMNPVN